MGKLMRSTFCLTFFLLAICFCHSTFVQTALAKQNSDPEENLVMDQPTYAIWQEAVRLMDEQKYDEAAEKYRKVIELLPEKASPHCNLMNCLIKEGKLEEAVKEASEAEKLAPDIPMYLSNLANAYQLAGRLNDAIDTYEDYLKRFPDSQQRGRIKATVKELKRAAEQKQGSPEQVGLADKVFAKWRSTMMPLRVFIEPGDSVTNYKADFKDILTESFQDWAKASNGHISFQFVDNKKACDIFCVFEAERNRITAAEDGNTRLESESTGMIRSARIILLTTAITGAPMSDTQIKGVALHEIGHALGISQHSRDPNDVMFYSMHGTQAVSALTDHDKATLNQLYDRPDSAQVPLYTHPMQFQFTH